MNIELIQIGKYNSENTPRKIQIGKDNSKGSENIIGKIKIEEFQTEKAVQINTNLQI